MSVIENKNTSITDRTKAFAIRIIKTCSFLDEKPGVCRTLSRQLLRSGTSIGANVRESRSAQSDKEVGSRKSEVGSKREKITLVVGYKLTRIKDFLQDGKREKASFFKPMVRIRGLLLPTSDFLFPTSDKDFLHKMEIALKEARETEYWLEILIESGVVEKFKFDPLLQEAEEIVKILVASTRKIKEKLTR